MSNENVPQVPDKDLLGKVELICMGDEPYTKSDGSDDLFVAAMKESLQWHKDKCDFYNKLLSSKGFDLDSLKSIDELENIPYIFANFFKKYEIKSISDEEVSLHLTSSGTTGQKSQMFFDDWSISSAQRMVDRIFDFHGWVTPDDPCNYLLYTYEPESGSKLGTAYTDNFLCKYAPVNEAKYALGHLGKQGHRFDVFGCIEALRRFEKDGKPVRIFGFPAFLYFTLKQMKEIGMEPLRLNPESLVFLGGGWKGNQDKAISKNELYSLVTEVLGIPDERLRDGFGSVEHCVPYIECRNHKFHIPVWSRVLIRDVKTLRPLPAGECGYLNFISPYITSVPANSVLMGDLATWHEGHDCPGCGVDTPYFEIVGRAGTTKGKSCAIAASELLNEFS